MISVRARMISLITSTKFKTTSGQPISLVGLHGKDEILVVGPTWAIARLATGEVPKKVDTPPSIPDLCSRIETELLLLKNLPALLSAKLNIDQIKDRDEILAAMFRTNLSNVELFFSKNDMTSFSERMIAETNTVLVLVKDMPYRYPDWWIEWDENKNVAPTNDPLITPDGRHITAYPIAQPDGTLLSKARTKNLTSHAELAGKLLDSININS